MCCSNPFICISQQKDSLLYFRMKGIYKFLQFTIIEILLIDYCLDILINFDF